jgi:hypothetical protein
LGLGNNVALAISLAFGKDLDQSGLNPLHRLIFKGAVNFIFGLFAVRCVFLRESNLQVKDSGYT